jgi:hypothetical protein
VVLADRRLRGGNPACRGAWPGRTHGSRAARARDFEEAFAVIATVGRGLARGISEPARSAGRPDLSILSLDVENEILLQRNHDIQRNHDTTPPRSRSLLGPLGNWLSLHLACATLFFGHTLPGSFGI